MYTFNIFNTLNSETTTLESSDILECIGLRNEIFLNTLAENNYKQKQVYIHIPYCMKQCSFCVYYTTSLKNRLQIEDYVNLLDVDLRSIAKISKNINFDAIYFGGGTVTILSSKDLIRIFDSVLQMLNINISAKNEFTVEMEPSTTTVKKIDIVANYGANRISFGIQSFNKKLLEKNNRRQIINRKFAENIKYIRKNYPHIYINADLIVGVEGRNFKNLIEDFNILHNLEMDSITVYINMLIFRNKKKIHEKNKLINDLMKLSLIYSDEYILNKNVGPNEFNIFEKKNAKDRFNKRYLDIFADNAVCLGVGRKAQTFFNKTIFWYDKLN